MKIDLHFTEQFKSRHIGPDDKQTKEMLSILKVQSVDELIDQTIPKNIRLSESLNLPEAKTEKKYIDYIRGVFAKNVINRSFIGMGYYNTQMPPVIQRNILENPGWYTAYTPYQAEIAQGRLEALMNFQTMVADLTGMDLSNASLLDEGTAAAEAMYMLSAVQKGTKKKARTFFVSDNTFPQTLDVLKTRAGSHDINLIVGNINEIDFANEDLYGVYIQNPDNNGEVHDHTDLITRAHENSVLVCLGVDLMSLVFVKSAGEMGADAAIGNSQRFGVPMGYGGPHAAFLATREDYKRQLPGRIIGASLDANGNNAYRMALQTREQHIKRERATSNICTAQVLLGVLAGMYGVYHGPEGLKKIAGRIHGLTQYLENQAVSLGYSQSNNAYFDTISLTLPKEGSDTQLKQNAEKAGLNFRYFGENVIGISLDETTRFETIEIITEVLASISNSSPKNEVNIDYEIGIPSELQRKLAFMTHPVFNSYKAEHEMLRYIKRLENKDVSLTHSMISLGSCTMKLNATSEMLPLSWPKVSQLHPFAPYDQVSGYHQMLEELEEWLAVITGFSATSLQPNSGAQGEYSGLMVIQAYHQDRGEGHRNVTLIPASAHGTNPASAVMAGNKVIIVASDEKGNIDVSDLRAKAVENKENLMSLMITYPSTHGVFEESIIDICNIIHENGGLVYMDGANMNAQVGLTSPANIGADVCHLNLHKTFAIPHGGGGPGVGPICVTSELAPFLPGSPVVKSGGEKAITAISSAPWGSASVAIISHAYIAMMGGEGLKEATKYAIFNANYIKERLATEYPILYSGINGRCAHEMIVDFRQFKAGGIEVVDVAKRLMDYGFHAPTVSFPVPGTLMIEPTESETKDEMDRFCDALLSIKNEIDEVISDKMDAVDNVLKNAPHTASEITADEWPHGYSRSLAAYPLPFVIGNKFWPAVARVDDAYGDRNLMCNCLPVEAYADM
jgi:glycine cleavage system P protein (glycine dehydrogenase)